MLARCVLTALFAAALGLRLVGIDFGLPHLYHPDEPAYVLQALAVGRGLPQGLTFGNPPLFKYVLLAEYAAAYSLGRLTGRYASPKDFVTRFRADPTLLYRVARVTSAVFGAVTVCVVYALGTSLGGRSAGLVAALLQATAYLPVRESHFGVNDSLVELLVALALLSCVRIVTGGARRDYLAAGVLVGLAFTAKYHGAAAGVCLLLAHALRVPRRPPRELVLGLVATAAAGLATFPSLALEPGRVLREVYTRLYLPGRLGYGGLDASSGYHYYLRVFGWGLGWPLVIAGVLGVLVAAARRDRPLLVVAMLPVTLYAFLGYQRMFFARLMLPAVPALVVLAAVAADRLAHAIAARARRVPAAAALTVAAAAALVALPLWSSLRFDRLLTRTDTRTEARAWVDREVPAGARVAVDALPFGPPLAPGRHDLVVADRHAVFDLAVAQYRSRGVQYVVASSYAYDQPVQSTPREAARRRFFEALAVEAELVTEFRPYAGEPGPRFIYDQIYAPFTELDRLERPGPTIRVYRLRPGAPDAR